MTSMTRNRMGAQARPVFAAALVLGLLLLLSLSASASATVSGPFCNGNFLGPGDSCHSPYFHSDFHEVSGYGQDGNGNGIATCVGIDQTTHGPNYVNQCSSLGVDCVSACAGWSGYAYVHDHDPSKSGAFYGYLSANS